MLSEFRRSGVEEALFGNVVNTHVALTRLRGLPKPSVSTLSAVCARLARRAGPGSAPPVALLTVV